MRNRRCLAVGVSFHSLVSDLFSGAHGATGRNIIHESGARWTAGDWQGATLTVMPRSTGWLTARRQIELEGQMLPKTQGYRIGRSS